MNAQQIIDLFLDGAYHQDGKFYHPSFRKGFRSIKFSNISLMSAEQQLIKMGKLKYDRETGVTTAQ